MKRKVLLKIQIQSYYISLDGEIWKVHVDGLTNRMKIEMIMMDLIKYPWYFKLLRDLVVNLPTCCSFACCGLPVLIIRACIYCMYVPPLHLRTSYLLNFDLGRPQVVRKQHCTFFLIRSMLKHVILKTGPCYIYIFDRYLGVWPPISQSITWMPPTAGGRAARSPHGPENFWIDLASARSWLAQQQSHCERADVGKRWEARNAVMKQC